MCVHVQHEYGSFCFVNNCTPFESVPRHLECVRETLKQTHPIPPIHFYPFALAETLKPEISPLGGGGETGGKKELRHSPLSHKVLFVNVHIILLLL